MDDLKKLKGLLVNWLRGYKLNPDYDDGPLEKKMKIKLALVKRALERALTDEEDKEEQAQPQAQAPKTYVVQRGENLTVLSKKHGVSIEALKEANADKLKRWGDVEGFNAGEEIVIPSGSSSSSTTTTTTTEPTTDNSNSDNADVEYEQSDVSKIIQGGESGSKGYNAYNRGTKGGRILGAQYERSLVDMTIGQIKADQARGIDDPQRLFAVGKYQMIPVTLNEGTKTLNIPDSTKYSPEIQEILFSDYLMGKKRPAIRAYITSQEGATAYKAQLAGAQEWASIACPPGHKKAGHSYYGNGNHASISAEDFLAALDAAKADYQKLIGSGVDPDAAYRQAVTGVQKTADSGDDSGDDTSDDSSSTTDEPTTSNQTYIVQPGEGLIAIANKLGVSVEALKAANADKLQKWGDVEGFNKGEEIVVPNGGSTSSSSETSTTTDEDDDKPQTPIQANSNIKKSVGKGGDNDPADVVTVQKLLKEEWKYDVPTDGQVDDKTIQAIRQFQHRYAGFTRSQDCVVDAGGTTWKYLIGEKKPEFGVSDDGVIGGAETETEKKLAEFTKVFSGIAIDIGDGEIVNVRAPYFINRGDRLENALAARRANRRVSNIIDGLGALGKVGKATPDQIKEFLEECIKQNLISDKTSQGLHEFLSKYGVSTDCSGLAIQAANFLAEGNMDRESNQDEEFQIQNTGAIADTAGHEHISSVSSPEKLQAGDMMVKGGSHVRVIIDVDKVDGKIQFTTVESGGSSSLGDGGDGVGQLRWEFPNPKAFEDLKVLKGNNWQNAGSGDRAYIYNRFKIQS